MSQNGRLPFIFSASFRGVQWVQLHPPILRSTQFATIEFEFFAEFDREKIN